MKKFIFFLLFVGLGSLKLSAQQVTKEVARDKAIAFIQQKLNPVSRVRKVSGNVPQLTLANDRDEFFVFNDEAKGGYIIVSGDERTPDILAYSPNGHYNESSIPCNMKAVLDSYAEQISFLHAHPDYKMPASTRSEETKIDPLLGETAWSQGWPYNEMCPMIDGQHCVTGCVATATAQVMYYHKWPERGQGSNSYEWNGQMLSADFSQSVYRWDLMTPTYNSNSSQESCDAVALLMKDVGYACKMNYSLDGSGTGLGAGVLVNYFDYDASYGGISRDFCNADTWNGFIMEDLKAGIPILYSAGSPDGAHAMVLDGYDGDGRYHFNFGWGGDSNGYYTILSNYFNSSPHIYFGIKKNEGGAPRVIYSSREDFKYVPEKDIFTCDISGVWSNHYAAMAVENTATNEIIYVDQQEGTGTWLSFRLEETLADGNYILYPVAHPEGDNVWHKSYFHDNRQAFVDLNVTNGEKTFANNHIADDIQEGAVEIDNIYYFLDDTNHEATVTFKNDKYKSYSGDVTIPTTIKYKDQEYCVTEIGRSAFHQCNIGVLKIAKTISKIDVAFYLAQIDRILFEKDSKLEEIAGFAFDGCNVNSGQLDLPEGLKYIYRLSFYGLYAPWFSIPKSISNLNKEVFYEAFFRCISVHWDVPLKPQANPFGENDDISLYTLYVPKGTVGEYIQADTWKNFGRIIEIGDTITIDGIKYMLFEKDHSASILSAFDMRQSTCVIPSVISYLGSQYTVNYINPYSFVDCPVTELTIPSTVEYFSEGAFQKRYNESKLSHIKLYHKDPPKVADMTEQGKKGFYPLLDDFNKITLYVPSGCKSKYETDNFWSQFANIEEDDALGISRLLSNPPNENQIIYSISGIKMNITDIKNMHKGIYIQNGKKIVIR